ncbi:hypothetical protein [Paraburkholderia oxyphila]|uniref:hypothetical protein n=1 Tax=Paraburkholderia oxyphila TaxID=614212 RepID=UPI00047F838F|nr:hypothetical protein [Paraburkholderia oxyphila]
MALNLPIPLVGNTWKQQLEQADKQNLKANADVIIGGLPSNARQPRLILMDSSGGAWQITVSTTGALSTTKVTL